MTMSKTSSPGLTEREDRSRAPAGDSIQTILFRDHERLDRQFRSIIYASERADAAELRAAWMTFEHELERHLDVEETQILPRFARSRPREARVLTEEHDQIRAQLLDMGVALDLHSLGPERIRGFADTLRAHTRHEDALLYPWANQHLGPAPRAAVTTVLTAAYTMRPAGAEDGWWIDTSRSRLSFSLRHLVMGQIRGRFARWGGTVRLEPTDLRRSTVRVWVELASIDTDDQERDAQVRSGEFFDVAHFPRAVFTGKEVQLAEGRRPVVVGSLDLHGIKAEVALEIIGDLPRRSEPTTTRMSFEMKGRLDRQRFGLRWNQDLDVGGVVVGDEVEVTAQLELVSARTAT